LISVFFKENSNSFYAILKIRVSSNKYLMILKPF